jgi:hypothetical protein
MKLYKDPNTNEVYAYEADGSQDVFIKDWLIPITAFEADALRSSNFVDAHNALPYDLKRAAEYPPITDYLDGIVKNDQSQIDKYIADCIAVKDKYPKAGE